MNYSEKYEQAMKRLQSTLCCSIYQDIYKDQAGIARIDHSTLIDKVQLLNEINLNIGTTIVKNVYKLGL